MADNMVLQITALRQRLGDMALGAIYAASEEDGAIHGLQSAIISAFDVPNSLPNTTDLDSLAAWLWERGCR